MSHFVAYDAGDDTWREKAIQAVVVRDGDASARDLVAARLQTLRETDALSVLYWKSIDPAHGDVGRSSVVDECERKRRVHASPFGEDFARHVRVPRAPPCDGGRRLDVDTDLHARPVRPAVQRAVLIGEDVTDIGTGLEVHHAPTNAGVGNGKRDERDKAEQKDARHKLQPGTN